MQPMGLAMDVVSLMDQYHDLFGPPPWHLDLKAAPFGFRCGWGWLPLIRGLLANLRLVAQEDGLTFRIEQVRQRFDQLQVTVRGSNDPVWRLLQLAETASGRICEGCSAPSEVVNRSGWLTTLCPVCLKAPAVAERWRESTFNVEEGTSPHPPLVSATVGQLWQVLGAIRLDLPLAVEEPTQGRHWPIRDVEVVRVASDPRRFEGVVTPHRGPGFDDRLVALIRPAALPGRGERS